MTLEPRIHRHATGPERALVNAYLVETSEGVVAVDGTLTVSDGRALRARVEASGQATPCGARHPRASRSLRRHRGAGRRREVPVVATAGVDAVIRRDDALKEEILRPMFGDEWPLERTFPNRTASDGERLELGGASFTVLDLGRASRLMTASGSSATSGKRCSSATRCTTGRHAYLADGFFHEWLATSSAWGGSYPRRRPFSSDTAEPSRLRTSTGNASTSRRSSTPSAALIGRNRTRPELRSSSG